MRKAIIFGALFLFLAFICNAISFNRIIYPIKTMDASEYELKQEKAPDRIACSSPVAAEILFAFNLSDKMVGLTEKCDYPDDAKKLPRIGGDKIDRNKMMKAAPDILILNLSDYSKDEITSFREIKFSRVVTFETWKGETSTEVRDISLEVFAIDPKSLSEIMQTITVLGTVTNREHAAYSLKQKLNRRIEWVAARARKSKNFGRLRAIVLTSRRPLSVAGEGTYLNDMIRLEGFIDVSKRGKEADVKMSRKEIEAANPDIIITSTDIARNPKDIYNSRDFRKTGAGKNKRVICIDKVIFERPGPRAVNMLEQIGEFAYGWSSTNEPNE